MKSLITIVLSLAVVFSSVATGGCQSPNYSGKGTLLGGLGGAGLGAAIGSKNGKNGLPGALIGGAVGAIAGNAIGESMDQDRAVAQQQAYAQGSGAQAAQGAVTPQDVINMSRSGLSEDVIATHIRTNGMTQRMQVNDLIYLRNQGVPDSVIQAMQQAPTAQARYQAAYSAALPPPPVRPVVVEHIYATPAYCPPPLYYHHGYHNHGHYHRPSNHVHWGFSFGH